MTVINISFSSFFAAFSANKMQKQVEVRMDESHLEPRVEKPESACSSLCDKIMNNMVLTLTILGKFLVLLYFHSQSIYYNPPLILF